MLDTDMDENYRLLVAAHAFSHVMYGNCLLKLSGVTVRPC